MKIIRLRRNRRDAYRTTSPSATVAPLPSEEPQPPTAIDVGIDGTRAIALTSNEVFPPDPPLAALRGALASGAPSYDAVIAEHVPLAADGESCRSCGFVYTDRRVCPAVILATAGYALLADRIRVVPVDREYGALCELAVAVQRMDARLDLIGARVASVPAKNSRWTRRVCPRK